MPPLKSKKPAVVGVVKVEREPDNYLSFTLSDGRKLSGNAKIEWLYHSDGRKLVAPGGPYLDLRPPEERRKFDAIEHERFCLREETANEARRQAAEAAQRKSDSMPVARHSVSPVAHSSGNVRSENMRTKLSPELGSGSGGAAVAEAPKPADKPKRKPAAKKAAAKKAPAKKAKKSDTGNLTLEEARVKVCKALNKKEMNRTELKAVAPYGNYSGLMNGLEEDGCIKPVPDPKEERGGTFYTLMAKGKKLASGE